jgi:hypothetical protein
MARIVLQLQQALSSAGVTVARSHKVPYAYWFYWHRYKALVIHTTIRWPGYAQVYKDYVYACTQYPSRYGPAVVHSLHL